jgi:hypothetical protein
MQRRAADLTEPGTYEVYVWLIGEDSEPDQPATATPAGQRAALGGTAKVTVSCGAISRPANAYLGLIGFRNDTDTIASTTLKIAPGRPRKRSAPRLRAPPTRLSFSMPSASWLSARRCSPPRQP